MDRRGFLKLLGLGSAAAVVLPLEEMLDRLAFAKSPTTSIYLPIADNRVQQWADDMFVDYMRYNPLRELMGSDQNAILEITPETLFGERLSLHNEIVLVAMQKAIQDGSAEPHLATWTRFA